MTSLGPKQISCSAQTNILGPNNCSQPDFYIRMYYYFLGNYTGFMVRSYYILKRKMFSKTLFLPTHVFLFCAPPGFSCWKFVSTRILDESMYRWLPLRVWSLPTLLYFTYALTSCVKWVHSRSQRILSLGTFRFKFIHMFHITILYGFVTFQVSTSTARFGVRMDIPGQGVSIVIWFNFTYVRLKNSKPHEKYQGKLKNS